MLVRIYSIISYIEDEKRPPIMEAVGKVLDTGHVLVLVYLINLGQFYNLIYRLIYKLADI